MFGDLGNAMHAINSKIKILIIYIESKHHPELP